MRFRVSVQFRDRGALSAGLDTRVRLFTEEIASVRRKAAATATSVSRSKVTRTRPTAPSRPGRPFSPIESNLTWKSGIAGDQDLVRLDTKTLDEKSRYWIVQNVGTGKHAVIHQAGKPNPQGRPATLSNYVKSVKSQEGRRIRAGLVFADEAGNFVAPTQSIRNQQLYLRSKVSGVPSTPSRSQPGIIIRKEIKPQRFVQAGGKEGFREYRGSVLSAARSAFSRPE